MTGKGSSVVRAAHDCGSAQDGGSIPPPSKPLQTLDEIVQRAVLARLKRLKGNRTETAKSLNVALRTIRNRITEYRIAGYSVPEPSRRKAK